MEDTITLPINTYPETFICTDSTTNIETIFIYKRQKQVINKMQYSKIGSGKFWNGSIDLDPDEVITEGRNKCFSFNHETDLIHLAVHDGGDLAGLDSRYNLGSHSCTYFCIYCQTDDKNELSAKGACYRTRENISRNAELFRQVSRNPSSSKDSPLQISRGVAGHPPDPYPSASTITPPLLHVDMGITTYLLKVHSEQIQLLEDSTNINYKQQHNQKLDQYKIYTNRYYKSLEGRQAKKYRQNFSIIASVLSPSPIYHHLNNTVHWFNVLMSIIAKPEALITEDQCDEANRALLELDKTWKRTKNMFSITSSLGTKYHYLYHCIEYMRIWGLPIGYISEQSIENYHKTCSMILRRYRNQRGVLRIKCGIHQLLLKTSPLYQS